MVNSHDSQAALALRRLQFIGRVVPGAAIGRNAAEVRRRRHGRDCDDEIDEVCASDTTTGEAYAILRHNGVDVGKMDFLGGANWVDAT